MSITSLYDYIQMLYLNEITLNALDQREVQDEAENILPVALEPAQEDNNNEQNEDSSVSEEENENENQNNDEDMKSVEEDEEEREEKREDENGNQYQYENDENNANENNSENEEEDENENDDEDEELDDDLPPLQLDELGTFSPLLPLLLFFLYSPSLILLFLSRYSWIVDSIHLFDILCVGYCEYDVGHLPSHTIRSWSPHSECMLIVDFGQYETSPFLSVAVLIFSILSHS
jgi:hypothetical protein